MLTEKQREAVVSVPGLHSFADGEDILICGLDLNSGNVFAWHLTHLDAQKLATDLLTLAPKAGE
jgi:hypothetical protein